MNIKVKRQLWLSVLGCVICPPLGLLSLFYSGKAGTRLKAGDSYSARLLVGRACFWSNTALVVGVLVWAGAASWTLAR